MPQVSFAALSWSPPPPRLFMCLPFYGNDTAVADGAGRRGGRVQQPRRRQKAKGPREGERARGPGVLRQRDNPPEAHTGRRGERGEEGEEGDGENEGKRRKEDGCGKFCCCPFKLWWSQMRMDGSLMTAIAKNPSRRLCSSVGCHHKRTVQ